MKSIVKIFSLLLIALIIGVTNFQGIANAQVPNCIFSTNTLLPRTGCILFTTDINQLVVSARNAEPLYPATVTILSIGDDNCGRILTLNQANPEVHFYCKPAQHVIAFANEGPSPVTINLFQASHSTN